MDLRNHFSITSHTELDQICGPLKKLGITYFNYLNIYHDDHRRALLCNRPDWIAHFYNEAFYQTAGAINVEHLLPKGYFLWDELDQQDAVYDHSRSHFQIDHGITFVVKKATSTQLYIFATNSQATHMNHFYVHHLDLLKRFMLYFHDKGAPLINDAEKNCIFLPEKQSVDQSIHTNSTLTEAQRACFFSETEMKRYHLIHNDQTIYLTKKQAQCAAFLAAGATSKLCAKKMGISPRTVEDYFEAIKLKLCTIANKRLTKTEVIDFLKINEVPRLVFPEEILFT